MQSLLDDIQFACRNFLKTPAVCMLIVATLALGIGANAAIFSMVYNVLMAPLPFSEGERLVKINTNKPKINRTDEEVSVATMFDYRNNTQTLSHVVEYHQMNFTLLGNGDPKSLRAGTVSWEFFEMLKVKPILGRTFLPGEDEPGAKPLIVLSHHYWRDAFGSDPDIVGMTLEMNDAAHQVIGVLPPMPAYPVKNDIWLTSSSCPMRGSMSVINDRGRNMLTLYGKLKPEVSLQLANLDINSISKRMAAQYPDFYPQSQGLSNTLIPLRTEMAGESSSTFYLLMIITSLVLLIACANVANLNLARTARRKQEFAIREALGANPRRISRQVLTESIILSLLGGLLGLLIAYFSIDLLATFAARYTPLASEVSINSGVLVFCFIVSLLTGIISGSTAAFQKRNINEALKEGSGNITASNASTRLRQALLIVQFCLAFIILTSASLISLSLYRLNTQDIGFDTTDILAVEMGPGASVSTVSEWQKFARETALRLEAKSEIESVAFATSFPLTGKQTTPSFFQIEGQPPADVSQRVDAVKQLVSANYHQVLHIPLLQGRYLAESDDKDNPGSIVINKRFADQFFSNINPIDKRISLDEGKTWLSIRGVVADTREMSVDLQPSPTFYAPFIESTRWSWLRLLISSPVSLESLIPSVTETIHEINPRQAVASTSTLQFIKEDSLSSENLVALLVSLFALLAFLIALSGVVGVVTYNISQRRKEIGIRVALGANPKRIRALFTAQGLSLGAIGLTLGAFTMVFVSPLLEGLLFMTSALNPAIFLANALLITLVTTLAILWPTRQATAIQPNEALRQQ
jgi:putative ABC transport system permease protein